MKNMITGALCAFGVGFVVYFTLYGLILTHTIDGIPVVKDLFSGFTQVHILWLSIFIAVLFFAFNYLDNRFKSVLSTLFIIALFFWFKDRIPGFSQAIDNMFNSLTNLLS